MNWRIKELLQIYGRICFLNLAFVFSTFHDFEQCTNLSKHARKIKKRVSFRFENSCGIFQRQKGENRNRITILIEISIEESTSVTSSKSITTVQSLRTHITCQVIHLIYDVSMISQGNKIILHFKQSALIFHAYTKFDHAF